MTTYVALLRGVNVGGHKQVAMADLRDLLTQLGLSSAQSLLQSGNLLFQSRSKDPVRLERLLEAETGSRLGLQADYFVRTAAEWKAIAARNPFRTEGERDPGRLVVLLLKDAPDAKSVKALQAAIQGPEIVRAAGREMYVVYPDGIGRSRLTHAVIEKKLGTRGTARNWNTVLKVGAAVAETKS